MEATAFIIMLGLFFVALLFGLAWTSVAEERTKQIERICECIEYLATDNEESEP